MLALDTGPWHGPGGGLDPAYVREHRQVCEDRA